MSEDPEQEKFNVMMAEYYVQPLTSYFNDVLHGMRKGQLSDVQHRALRSYLERYEEIGGLIAGIYACRLADKGTPMYEWGVNTICADLSRIYTDKDLSSLSDKFNRFTLALLKQEPAARAKVAYEMRVWNDVRGLISSFDEPSA